MNTGRLLLNIVWRSFIAGFGVYVLLTPANFASEFLGSLSTFCAYGMILTGGISAIGSFVSLLKEQEPHKPADSDPSRGSPQ